MMQKLKDFPEEVKLFHKYLSDREKEDLSKVLVTLPKHKQLSFVLDRLVQIQLSLDNKDNILDLSFKDSIVSIKKDLTNLNSSEEYKKQEALIKKYKKSKSELIASLLEEDCKRIFLRENSYYGHAQGTQYIILNLPNVNVGRFYEMHLSLQANSSYHTSNDSILCGNLIVPIVEITDKSSYIKKYLLLMCSTDFLYKENVWNENCINFMSTRFNAKKTLSKTINSAISANKKIKISGEKPEWIKNYEIMK